MIGDYLIGQPHNRIVRVIELRYDDIVCDQRCYDVEPIRINADILKICGFKRHNGEDMWQLGNIYLSENNGEWMLHYYSSVICVRYIHEVQHLVKLFKNVD